MGQVGAFCSPAKDPDLDFPEGEKIFIFALNSMCSLVSNSKSAIGAFCSPAKEPDLDFPEGEIIFIFAHNSMCSLVSNSKSAILKFPGYTFIMEVHR